MIQRFTKAQVLILAFTVFLLLVFLIVPKIINKKPTLKVEENQIERIDHLELQIKKFQVQQIVLDSAFRTLNDSIISLQYDIEEKELQILKLKTKKHETNIVVRNFNDSDITNFFSNRYK